MLMLCTMAFHSCSKVVAFHLHNSTVKAPFCNQGGTVSLSLSRPACHNENLANKHGITLIPAYIPTHCNVEANTLSHRSLVLEYHLLT